MSVKTSTWQSALLHCTLLTFLMRPTHYFSSRGWAILSLRQSWSSAQTLKSLKRKQTKTKQNKPKTKIKKPRFHFPHTPPNNLQINKLLLLEDGERWRAEVFS